MQPIGSTISVNGFSGAAPGQNTWDMTGKQGKVLGTRNVGGQNYYNVDFGAVSPGQGTGWVSASSLGGGSPSAAAPATAQSNLPAWSPPQTNISQDKQNIATAGNAAPGQIQDFSQSINNSGNQAINDWQSALPGIVDSANKQYNVAGLQQNEQHLGDVSSALTNRINELQTAPSLAGGLGMAGSDAISKTIGSYYMPLSQNANNQYQNSITQEQQASTNAQGLMGLLSAPYAQKVQMISQLGPAELSAYSSAIGQRLDALKSLPQLSLTQQQQLNELATTQQQLQTAIQTANIGANATIKAAGMNAGATVQAARIGQAGNNMGLILAAGGTMNPDGTLNTSTLDQNKLNQLLDPSQTQTSGHNDPLGLNIGGK